MKLLLIIKTNRFCTNNFIVIKPSEWTTSGTLQHYSPHVGCFAYSTDISKRYERILMKLPGTGKEKSNWIQILRGRI